MRVGGARAAPQATEPRWPRSFAVASAGLACATTAPAPRARVTPPGLFVSSISGRAQPRPERLGLQGRPPRRDCRRGRPERRLRPRAAEARAASDLVLLPAARGRLPAHARARRAGRAGRGERHGARLRRRGTRRAGRGRDRQRGLRERGHAAQTASAGSRCPPAATGWWRPRTAWSARSASESRCRDARSPRSSPHRVPRRSAGCGLGEGEERGGAAVELRVTRDFGHEELGTARIENVREDETVMRMLRSEFDIDTRYGGRFVQTIDGLEGAGAGGQRDWFYWVNGVEGSVGAAEFELSPGDRVQWDWRNWQATHARARDRRRLPRAVRARARGQAPAGAGGVREQQSPRPAVTLGRCSRRPAPLPRRLARRARDRDDHQARRRALAGGADRPRRVRARGRAGDDRRVRPLRPRRVARSSCSTSGGEVARTVRPGDGVGIVLAMRPLEEELVWLATGLDERGRRRRRAGARRGRAARRLCGRRRWPYRGEASAGESDEPDPRLPAPPEPAARSARRGRRVRSAARSR